MGSQRQRLKQAVAAPLEAKTGWSPSARLNFILPAWGRMWSEAGPYDLLIFPHRCQLSLGGHPLAIQTYAWDKSTYGNGKKYITTAYVVSPTQ